MRTIVVSDYDPGWPGAFERVRANVWPVVKDIAVSIEHVGSTAVPGLAAKPIVDVTVVVPSEDELPLAIERLARLGYVHRGTLGIPQREAFDSPPDGPAHHLYVCSRDSTALANHLAVRDHLRAHPQDAKAYGALKKRLAAQFPHDIEGYVQGKTSFLIAMLRVAGLPPERLAAIERANTP